MQVYNLGINDTTKSNEAKVTYQIIDFATNTVVFEKEQDSKDFGEHSDQLTVEKTLPIAGLQPGKYKVTIKINDDNLETRDCAIGALCRGIVIAPRILGYPAVDRETRGEMIPGILARTPPGHL